MSRPCRESGATRPQAPRHVGPPPSGSRRPSPPRHPLSRRCGGPSASGSRRPSPPRRPPSRHGGAPPPPRRPPSRHDRGPSPPGLRGLPPPARRAPPPPPARSAPGPVKPSKPPPPASKGPPPPATKRPPPPAAKRPPPPATKRPPPVATKRPAPPPSTGGITKLERRRERNRLLMEAEQEKIRHPARAADRKRILWFAGQSWHGCANCASYETLMAPEALRAWVVRAALDLGIADAKLCAPSPELPHPLLWQTPDCVDFPDFFNRVKGHAISQRLPLVEGMEWWMERAKTESEGPDAKRRREDTASTTASASSATTTTGSGSTRSAAAPAGPILAESPASPKLPTDRGSGLAPRHAGSAEPARSSTSSSRSSSTSATCVLSADSSPSSPSPMTDMDTPLSPEPQEAPEAPSTSSRDTATPTTPALTTPDLPLACCDELLPSAPPLRTRLSSARSEDTWEWDPERPLVHNGCCFPGASSAGCCQADAGAGGLSTDTSPADPAAAGESRTPTTTGPGFEPGGDEAAPAGSRVELIPEDDDSVTCLGDVVRGAGERTVNVVIGKVEEAEGSSLGFQLRKVLEASPSSSGSENIYKDCDQQAQLPPDRLSEDTVAVTPMESENEPPHHHHRANRPKKRARCNDVNVLRSKLINIMRDTKLKVLPST